jgi:hypothetical protein
MKNLSRCLPAALLVLIGCGGGDEDRPDLYPVSGTVVYNGEPVPGATVSFWAEGAPRAAVGTTNAEGKFTLTMFEFNDGAMAGDNKITVSKAAAGAAGGIDRMAMLDDPTAQASMAQTTAPGTETQETTMSLPAKYADQNLTPLMETVKTEGENVFPLQLTD